MDLSLQFINDRIIEGTPPRLRLPLAARFVPLTNALVLLFYILHHLRISLSVNGVPGQRVFIDLGNSQANTRSLGNGNSLRRPRWGVFEKGPHQTIS